LLEIGKILVNQQLAKDVYEMELEVPGIAKLAKPGQFVNLRLSDKLDPLLRRPISLHRIDVEKGTITMMYLVVGEGTTMMKNMEIGETIDVLGPLGNGWNTEAEGEHAVLIGGGIGVAPLYPLAKELVAKAKKVEVIIGAKSKDYLADYSAYEAMGAVVTVTITAQNHATVTKTISIQVKNKTDVSSKVSFTATKTQDIYTGQILKLTDFAGKATYSGSASGVKYDVLYTDEDKLNADTGLYEEPHFKPDFDWLFEYLCRTQMMLGLHRQFGQLTGKPLIMQRICLQLCQQT